MLDKFLATEDRDRAAQTFNRLASLDVSQLALAGGFAIELHILEREGKTLLRPLHDMDFLAATFDNIPNTLGRRFPLPPRAPRRSAGQDSSPGGGSRERSSRGRFSRLWLNHPARHSSQLRLARGSSRANGLRPLLAPTTSRNLHRRFSRPQCASLLRLVVGSIGIAEVCSRPPPLIRNPNAAASRASVARPSKTRPPSNVRRDGRETAPPNCHERSSAHGSAVFDRFKRILRALQQYRLLSTHRRWISLISARLLLTTPDLMCFASLLVLPSKA